MLCRKNETDTRGALRNLVKPSWKEKSPTIVFTMLLLDISSGRYQLVVQQPYGIGYDEMQIEDVNPYYRELMRRLDEKVRRWKENGVAPRLRGRHI
jgi:hypothetical protein